MAKENKSKISNAQIDEFIQYLFTPQEDISLRRMGALERGLKGLGYKRGDLYSGLIDRPDTKNPLIRAVESEGLGGFNLSSFVFLAEKAGNINAKQVKKIDEAIYFATNNPFLDIRFGGGESAVPGKQRLGTVERPDLFPLLQVEDARADKFGSKYFSSAQPEINDIMNKYQNREISEQDAINQINAELSKASKKDLPKIARDSANPFRFDDAPFNVISAPRPDRLSDDARRIVRDTLGDSVYLSNLDQKDIKKKIQLLTDYGFSIEDIASVMTSREYKDFSQDIPSGLSKEEQKAAKSKLRTAAEVDALGNMLAGYYYAEGPESSRRPPKLINVEPQYGEPERGKINALIKSGLSEEEAKKQVMPYTPGYSFYDIPDESVEGYYTSSGERRPYLDPVYPEGYAEFKKQIRPNDPDVGFDVSMERRDIEDYLRSQYPDSVTVPGQPFGYNPDTEFFSRQAYFNEPDFDQFKYRISPELQKLIAANPELAKLYPGIAEMTAATYKASGGRTSYKSGGLTKLVEQKLNK